MAPNPTNHTRNRLWSDEQRANLCKWVIDRLEMGAGEEEGSVYSLVYSIPNTTLLPIFRAAVIALLPPSLQRPIAGMSQVPWVRPLMIDILSNRHYPCLKVVSEDTSPSPSYDHLIRLIRRQGKTLRQLTATVETLTDLIMEVLPQTSQIPQTAPSSCSIRTDLPVVAIAGLRRHQQQALARRLKDVAIIEFVDASRRQPESLKDFDKVYCVRCTAQLWKRKAHQILGDRFEEARGTSLIAESIERLAGLSV